MKKILIVFTALLLLVGCSGRKFTIAKIHIKGSDTMLKLTRLLAEDYMKLHPGVSIYVSGGGTANGVKALISGDVTICTASRPLQPEEVRLLAERCDCLGMAHLIAKDALSIYLHPANPVKSLSLNQLKMIYTCEITNWKTAGGRDTVIVPVIRPPNSGTHSYFKEHVLDDADYCSDVIIENTTNKVIEEIKNNPAALGYGGFGYGRDLNLANINGIQPTVENVRNDKYPISRYLYFYTISTPKSAEKDFIDWVLGPDGQRIVTEAGYISLWEIPESETAP